MRYGNLNFLMDVRNSQSQKITPQNVLGKLLENKVLDQNTLAAVKVAFDPYHDSPIDFRGRPSQNKNKVFTWDDVGSVTISQSTSDVALDPDLPFNVCISTYPIGQSMVMDTGTNYGTVTAVRGQDVVAARRLSPITITYSQGASFPSLPLANPTTPTPVTGMTINPLLMNEKSDVCGWGVEVINATPMLNIGGTLTQGAIPQFDWVDNFSTEFVVQDGAGMGADFGPWGVRPMALCPTSEAQLLQFQGSQQWNAKEGAYVVVPINWVDYTESPIPMPVMAFTESLPTGTALAQPCYVNARQNITIGGRTDAVNPFAYNYLNCDSQCMMFTGLDPKTELTVRFKFWGQTEPKSNIVQLRAAKPAVPWNQDFIELATQMKCCAPNATFFTNNPSGEWWKTILGTAAELAPSILSMIPHPAARALAPVAAAAAPMLKSAAADSKTKRKAKNASGKYGVGMKKNKQGKIVPKKPKPAASGVYVPSKAT